MSRTGKYELKVDACCIQTKTLPNDHHIIDVEYSGGSINIHTWENATTPPLTFAFGILDKRREYIANVFSNIEYIPIKTLVVPGTFAGLISAPYTVTIFKSLGDVNPNNINGINPGILATPTPQALLPTPQSHPAKQAIFSHASFEFMMNKIKSSHHQFTFYKVSKFCEYFKMDAIELVQFREEINRFLKTNPPVPDVIKIWEFLERETPVNTTDIMKCLLILTPGSSLYNRVLYTAVSPSLSKNLKKDPSVE